MAAVSSAQGAARVGGIDAWRWWIRNVKREPTGRRSSDTDEISGNPILLLKAIQLEHEQAFSAPEQKYTSLNWRGVYAARNLELHCTLSFTEAFQLRPMMGHASRTCVEMLDAAITRQSGNQMNFCKASFSITTVLLW